MQDPRAHRVCCRCPLGADGIELRPREAFDVTLFIEMTTAARSNPR
jgi:hypothetical protein